MNELITTGLYLKIEEIIKTRQKTAKFAINSEMLAMNWCIGQLLFVNVLKEHKAEYGKNVVASIAEKLTIEFGKGFDKSSLFRMVKFYEEFPNFEKVATLSQQLTWSHFIELLPIKDPLKREFYAVMSINENWDVRTLRERKRSMLFERMALSKKPEMVISTPMKGLRYSRLQLTKVHKHFKLIT